MVSKELKPNPNFHLYVSLNPKCHLRHFDPTLCRQTKLSFHWHTLGCIKQWYDRLWLSGQLTTRVSTTERDYVPHWGPKCRWLILGRCFLRRPPETAGYSWCCVRIFCPESCRSWARLSTEGDSHCSLGLAGKVLPMPVVLLPMRRRR
jgi:hypothetical protein